MQTRRDKIRAGIVPGLAQDVSAYPLNQAKRDLITYVQAGTLPAGLQELQEEAGVATAAIKASAPTGPPNAPSSTFANVGVGQNVLTWAAVTSATTYTVYWANASPVSKSASKLDPVTVNDVVDPGRDPAKTYYYAITASNAAGESALSAEVHAQPVAAPTAASPGLPAPANLRAMMLGSTAVITFDAPAGAATFNVYKDSTSTATKSNRIFAGSTNLYVDTASDAANSFYSVLAVDISGNAGSQSAAKQPTPAAPTTTPTVTSRSPTAITVTPVQLH